MNRDERYRAIYEAFVYDADADPVVLKNIPNLQDYQQLELYERGAVLKRLNDGLPAEALKQTPDGLKAMHGYLFQDVYAWAGEYRPYPTARSRVASFALPEYIEERMDITFRKFEAEGELKGLKAPEFADKAASYVNELNAIHPFIDGNGRTQRIWLRNTCENAGFSIDLSAQDREPWNKFSMMGQVTADNSQTGYKADHPMRDFILSRLDWPDKKREQGLETALSSRLKAYEEAAERIAQTLSREQTGADYYEASYKSQDRGQDDDGQGQG